MGEMRIANIQDTLLKADLVQRLQEALLMQARLAQAEGQPQALEQTRRSTEMLSESLETREPRIREQEKGRREPFMGTRQQRQPPPEAKSPAAAKETGAEGSIIDVEA